MRHSLHSWGRPESTADSTGHLDSGEPLPAMNEDQYREFGRMLTATAEDVMNVPDTYVGCALHSFCWGTPSQRAPSVTWESRPMMHCGSRNRQNCESCLGGCPRTHL
jgi:hypothetical protein